MTELQAVDKFIKDFGHDYTALLGAVKMASEAAQQTLSVEVIDSIYTRADATNTKYEFKESGKIASKLRGRNLAVTPINIMTLTDIVGATVVVRYPDQVKQAIDLIVEHLVPVGVTANVEPQHQNKNGYYAQHVICTKRYDGHELSCEIQVKTILHNAWSAKMHGLTYKPEGYLDPRLATMMSTVATTIESLEIQSKLIRDMIHAGWNVEEKARRLTRRRTFEEMLNFGGAWQTMPDASEDMKALKRDIDAAECWMQDEPAESTRLKTLVDRVRNHESGQLRYAWILAGRLATLRPPGELRRFFSVFADQWLDEAPAHLQSKKIEPLEVTAVPLIYYVLGELDRAIDQSVRIRQDFSNLLPEPNLARLHFNWAVYIVEREYHNPSKNTPERNALREQLYAAAEHPVMKGDPELAVSVTDFKGALAIAFATTTEEVSAGIRLCAEAPQGAAASEKEIAQAYSELNCRLGWRRYFEIEAQDSAGAVS